MKTKMKGIFFVFLTTVLLAGCNANQRILQGGNQLELRSMQTRGFETTDKNMVVRTSIATLQDLGFVIDKADADLGTVTATKLNGYQIKMTVTVRPKGQTMTAVRANATYNIRPVEDPVLYQDFFAALEKSLFLTANEID